MKIDQGRALVALMKGPYTQFMDYFQELIERRRDLTEANDSPSAFVAMQRINDIGRDINLNIRSCYTPDYEMKLSEIEMSLRAAAEQILSRIPGIELSEDELRRAKAYAKNSEGRADDLRKQRERIRAHSDTIFGFA